MNVAWTPELEDRIYSAAFRTAKKADRIDDDVALYVRIDDGNVLFQSCGVNSSTKLLWDYKVRQGNAELVGVYNHKAKIPDIELDIKFTFGWADCHHAQTGWAKDRLRYKLG